MAAGVIDATAGISGAQPGRANPVMAGAARRRRSWEDSSVLTKVDNQAMAGTGRTGQHCQRSRRRSCAEIGRLRRRSDPGRVGRSRSSGLPALSPTRQTFEQFGVQPPG